MIIIYNEIAELSFKEGESLLHIKMLEGANMSLENTRNHYNLIKDVTGNKKYLALVDASNYFTIEPEALRYASLKEVINNRIAAAHYNSAAANKHTLNFFKDYYEPPIPLEMFNSKEKALQWLSQFKAELKN